MIVLFIILAAGCLLYCFLQPPVQTGEEAVPGAGSPVPGNSETPWADHLDWNKG